MYIQLSYDHDGPSNYSRNLAIICFNVFYREAVVSSLTREIQAVPVTTETLHNQITMSNVTLEENVNRSTSGTPEPVTSTTEQTHTEVRG